ncbi:uncharacterized protein PITG_04024 [Phytophthora infestans T30-4]|uniref:Uncharacterized protein n=1 Tax=Phytophthora infestans (strain T30-4) TaxID=403677 RepID=D0N0D0_PHYIT|nr:uncharacterized protein PITG_04024 [Phytophthora infestans T30-4]EEY67093.1 hypothetical protein PITG_04024 [Phytophthora infestans T30-4]|eukprot:XP_002905741.1 hypothetical protein PITG_04024 [Phytophthora infestans T30-4]
MSIEFHFFSSTTCVDEISAFSHSLSLTDAAREASHSSAEGTVLSSSEIDSSTRPSLSVTSTLAKFTVCLADAAVAAATAPLSFTMFSKPVAMPFRISATGSSTTVLPS